MKRLVLILLLLLVMAAGAVAQNNNSGHSPAHPPACVETTGYIWVRIVTGIWVPVRYVIITCTEVHD